MTRGAGRKVDRAEKAQRESASAPRMLSTRELSSRGFSSTCRNPAVRENVFAAFVEANVQTLELEGELQRVSDGGVIVDDEDRPWRLGHCEAPVSAHLAWATGIPTLVATG